MAFHARLTRTKKLPQLLENYKCGSAEGISLSFLTVWLVGDITNGLGALWAGLVPTVIALAVYFCFADTVLIAQCLYYNSINARKAARKRSNPADDDTGPDAREALLGRRNSDAFGLPGSRSRSSISRRRRSSQISGVRGDSLPKILEEDGGDSGWVRNTVSVVVVCAAGAVAWVVAWKVGVWKPTPEDLDGGSAGLARGPQILGYISALCYLR